LADSFAKFGFQMDYDNRLIEIVPRFASFALLTDLRAFTFFVFVSVEGWPLFIQQKKISITS